MTTADKWIERLTCDKYVHHDEVSQDAIKVTSLTNTTYEYTFADRSTIRIKYTTD